MKVKNCVRYQPPVIRFWVGLFALAFVQVASAGNFDSKGGWSYYSDGLGGTRVVSGGSVINSWPAPTAAYTGNLPKIGNTAVSVLPSGELSLSAKPIAKVLNKDVVLDVAAKVPKASVTAALGRFIGKSIPVLGIGVGLYDLAKELQYDVSKDDKGIPQFSRITDALYYNVPGSPVRLGKLAACEAWKSGATLSLSETDKCVAPQVWYISGWPEKSTPQEACTYWASSGGFTGTVQGSGCVLNTGYSQMILTTGTYLSLTLVQTTGGGSTTPVTQQQFLDDIASKSGWPSSSALGRTIVDAVQSGESLPVDAPTVTGPASVQHPSTTSTSQNPNPTTGATTGPGSSTTTTTTTPTTNITYAGDSYTTNVTNVTTTSTSVVNVDNSVTTTTKTDTETKPNEVEPEDPCVKNAESIGCSKFGDAPEPEKLTDKPFDLTVTPVAFASGGACPSPLSFTVIGQSYAISYQPICDQLYILKALFLMMAGVVAAYILADSFRV